MAALFGTLRHVPEGLTMPYQVFHRLATEDVTKNKTALLTDGVTMTFADLQKLVDTLEVWLLEVVDSILKRESQKVANYKAYLKESCTYGIDEDEQHSKPDTDNDPSSEVDPEKLESEENCAQKENQSSKRRKFICIALCMHRSPNLVALILAIWKLGWVYVPLDPAVPGVRTLFVLRDAEPVCVITDEHTNIKLRTLESDTSVHPQNKNESQESDESKAMSDVLKYCVSDRIVDIREWEKIDANQNNMEKCSQLREQHRGSADLACLMYTSGSTGNPKGVLLLMSNVMNRIYWQWNEFPFEPDEVCLMSKSLTFVDSLTELFVPLLAGVPVAIVKEIHINPEIIINYVGKFGVTRLVLVPSLLKLLILYLNTTKDSIRLLQLYLKLWISSGEPIPGWLLNDFFAMFPGSKFANFYGSTEVTGDVTFHKVEETTWKAGVKVPIGRPVANMLLLVLNKDKESYSCANKKESGEIVVIGGNVCAGYYQGKHSTQDVGAFIPLSCITFGNEVTRECVNQFLMRVYCAVDNKINVALSEYLKTSVTKTSGKENCQKEVTNIPESGVAVSKPELNGVTTGSIVTEETAPPARDPRSIGISLSPTKSRQGSSPLKTNRSSSNSPAKTKQNVMKEDTHGGDPTKQMHTISTLKELTAVLRNKTISTDTVAETPEGSLTVFPDHLERIVAYRTGDWGKIVGNHVIFEGRKDSQVKVRGVRVQLAEVDDAVHRSGYTNAHCVLAATEQDTEDEDHVLVAFVVLKSEFEERDTPITEDLLRCLRSYLPEVMVPRVVVLDALPHLPSGKVDRQALLKIYRRRMSHRSSKDNILILRKDEPIESRVLRIICGALGLARSQDVLNQNFFALGGSSITSVSVVVRLRDLGLDVTLEAFLKANTIGEVVNDILKAKTMAEVMNFFCSPSPGLPSSSSSSSSSQGKKPEEDFDEDEDEDPLCDLSIPAFHPDIPVCTSAKGQSKKPKGLRLALLHTQPLSQGVDKQTVIEILAQSFTTKNPLDVAVGVPKAAHRCLLNSLWPRLVQDDLSFVVKDPQRGILGAVINTDFFNEQQVRVPPSMREVAALHETLEEEARHTLSQEKKGQRWVHNLFLATNNCLTAQDNVRLVLHLERELLRVAQTRQYHGVFTVNSNPLNQLLCENYLGYRRRGTVRVASFWYEGRQPFGRLPHDLLLVAMTKAL